MVYPANNFAFIDGANLHKGVTTLGWKLDYRRFRILLEERYGVARAYLFMGNIPKYSAMYTSLQEAGYTLVFKQTTYGKDGQVKGNCDADLVLEAVRHCYEESYDQAVIVSSDGDYASLVTFLMEKKKLRVLLSPAAPQNCSILLKRTGTRISFIDEFRDRLAQK